MSEIKNIIFDLGGIFIDINYPKTEKAFFDLKISNFAEFYTQHHASEIFELLETGKLSPKEFYKTFREKTGFTIEDDSIRDAWNALLGDFFMERLQWLDEIRKRYKIYLFSNTNKIHYDAFMEIFRKQTGLRNFDDYFIKAYYSHECGFRKPYTESYQRILDEQNLIASETLFIDDTPRNIEGAKQAGLQAVLLLPGQSITELGL
jgi:putative hydrolase of the HAD superfamily